MTKRFKWCEKVVGNFVDEFVVDTLNDSRLDEEDMYYLLNELNEKNKQLQADVKYFNETYSIQEYGLDVETHIQLSSPILSRKELLNENKQLKEKLDYMGKALENILYDLEYSKKKEKRS